jgi:hypothetical protein
MEIMTLTEFLSKNAIPMATFAATVDTTTATVSRIADGIVVPRRDLMHRIYAATEGAVTPNDLVGLYCVQPCARVKGTRND